MIEYADVVIGCCWGDEGKGKVTAKLASKRNDDGSPFYSAVARWAGGNNAGHTVYKEGKKYKTHLIPSGIFYGIKSIIGPACVLNVKSFMEEISYLDASGFDTSLIKVSPKCHIVTEEHIHFDKNNLAKKLGTTSKGIAPAYAAKAARKGILAIEVIPAQYIWDEKLEGKILCEGAQGVWLDMDYGLYPYVTSSTTLPYGSCSLGFPPQKINRIWGIAKAYDTRSGEDPRFPESLFDDVVLARIAEVGGEYGVTTGRKRKVNWLNLSLLVDSINLSGVDTLVINKCDILDEVGSYELIHNNERKVFSNFSQMKLFMDNELHKNCGMLERVLYSYSPEDI
jgi:adenylosuccinate synthase